MPWIKTGRTWLVDHIIEHWPAYSVLAGGSVMTYLASASAWLLSYGPVAWGGVGVATVLVLSFSYFLFGLVRTRSASAQPAAPTASGAGIGIAPAAKTARAAMLSVFNKSADFASEEILHVGNHLYEFMRLSGGGLVFQTGILINDHVAGAHDNHRAALRNILTDKEAIPSLAQLGDSR